MLSLLVEIVKHMPGHHDQKAHGRTKGAKGYQDKPKYSKKVSSVISTGERIIRACLAESAQGSDEAESIILGLRWMGDNQPKVQATNKPKTAGLLRESEKGMKWLQQMLPPHPEEEHRGEAAGIQFVPGNKSATVEEGMQIADSASEKEYAAGNVVHEYGHWIDNLDYLAATKSYLATRSGGKIVKTTDAGHFLAGDYIDPYMGLEYDDDATSNEFVSVGLENLYRDPVGFKAKDPDSFHLLIGLIYGKRN